MKRFLPQILVGTLCLLFLTGSSSFAADSSSIKSIVDQQEITNINTLTERAKKSISDICIIIG